MLGRSIRPLPARAEAPYLSTWKTARSLRVVLWAATLFPLTAKPPRAILEYQELPTGSEAPAYKPLTLGTNSRHVWQTLASVGVRPFGTKHRFDPPIVCRLAHIDGEDALL
jgi:hypothetical protein